MNKEKSCGNEKQMDNGIKTFGWGIRHVQMACMWICMISLYMVRSSMGVAILAMTDKNRMNDTNIVIYDWDERIQGVVLSSFFWGYVLMQLPAGLLAKRFGGKLLILVALFGNGTLCALIPTFASVGGWPLVCVARVMTGLTQACLFPASHTLLGKWLPPSERTSCTGVVYAGSQLGLIVSMAGSGGMAASYLGWKLIFYSMAILLFAIAGIWYLFSANSPATHRLISLEEREYIELSLNSDSQSENKNRIPWRSIATSAPVWAIVAAHIGNNMGFVFFFTYMPAYLEKALHISLKDSALLSAVPYVGMWIGITVGSLCSEYVYNKGLVSATNIRKIVNSVGTGGTTIAMIFLSFLGPSYKVLAIVILVVALTHTGLTGAAFQVNHLDLSPNYAGLLFSISNLSANLGSVIIPLITGVILGDNSDDIGRWRIVFLAVSGGMFVTVAIYAVFASAVKQEWDNPDFEDRKKADPDEVKSLSEKEIEALKSSITI